MAYIKPSAILGCWLVIGVPFTGLARDSQNGAAANYPASYEGGTLGFDHSKVRATLGADQVILMQHGRRVAVPASSITGIDCATGVHRRFGAAVLGAVPYMHLGATQNHYVAVSWKNAGTAAQTPQVEAMFKLNKSEYGAFLSGLERLTGRKALDTNRTRTTVRYD